MIKYYCAYCCPGAEAPGHQQSQYWANLIMPWRESCYLLPMCLNMRVEDYLAILKCMIEIFDCMINVKLVILRYDFDSLEPRWKDISALRMVLNSMCSLKGTKIGMICKDCATKMKWFVWCVFVWVFATLSTQESLSQADNYHQASNIRHTKSHNLNVSCRIMQLSLPNPLKPGVKSRMKM